MTPNDICSKIDEILYSHLSKEEMLAELKPFIFVGDTKQGFENRTGITKLFGFTSGPDITHWSVINCGLEFVTDPKGFVRIIRRKRQEEDGKLYQECSLTEPYFQSGEYVRWYPN